MRKNSVRPADVLVAGNRLFIIPLWSGIWSMRYAKVKIAKGINRRNHIGNTMDLMWISIHLSVLTAANTPPTAAILARKAMMPETNVTRLLKRLIADGSATRMGKLYSADLDRLDSYVTRAYWARSEKALRALLKEWERLHLLLDDRLK